MEKQTFEEQTLALNKSLAALQKRKTSLVKKLDVIDSEFKELKKTTPVLCTDNRFGKGCGESSEVKDLTFIQTHWYESPSGCMGGDHWHQDEGRFTCLHCGHLNRLYDRKEIQNLKYVFKSIVEEHKHE